MNWRLATILVFTLNIRVYSATFTSSPNNHGVYARPQHAETESKPLDRVSYSVNAEEVLEGVKLLTTDTFADAQTTGLLEMVLSEDFFETVFLLNIEGVPVAFDVVARGVKEVLEFSAVNSAKADVVLALTLTGLSYDDIVQEYDSIQKNPRFPELLAMYRDAKAIPLSDEVRRLARLIAIDLYQKNQD